MNSYTIYKTTEPPTFEGLWDGPLWVDVPALAVDAFHEQGSDHQPNTQAKALYDDAGVYVIFRVEDRYVRCVHTQPNGAVYTDSCVEFFTEPVTGGGYFNFEINCGGSPLVHYNAQSESECYNPVEFDKRQLERLQIYHSMPEVVEPEIVDPTTWFVEFFVPYENLEAYVGPVPRGAGARWRANFYKCGDKTSHPHWGMWNRIPGELGFHRPEHFAELLFGDVRK